jgi:hypothetical protein
LSCMQHAANTHIAITTRAADNMQHAKYRGCSIAIAEPRLASARERVRRMHSKSGEAEAR